MSGAVFSSGVRPAHPTTEKEPPLMSDTPPLSDPESAQPDPTLLESQFRIARMMSYGPLTDEPGA